jgi:hypothetical protein
MPSKAEKLLEQMRNSKKSWKRTDLEALYTGFGFVISSTTGGHDKVTHPDFPQLITSLPRHRKIAIYNVVQAIRLIDKLKELEQGK